MATAPEPAPELRLRGRPLEQRPRRGDMIQASMRGQDIAVPLGMSRRKLALILDMAAVPEDEFEQLVEKPGFEMAELKKVARLRAGKSLTFERVCLTAADSSEYP